MGLAVQVPLNTMLADLDESLSELLVRELRRHGFDGVQVAFEAPSREWSAGLSAPTVSLFLHDLREATEERSREWREHRANGRARLDRPPLRVDCSYAVTAWTRAVQDEHRLLSQVLAVLYAYERLPAQALSGRLADPAAQRGPITTRVGAARGDGRADFWNAVGGRYKASLDYVVTLSCEPGVAVQRGPEARTHTLAVRDRDAAPGAIEHLHRTGGVVRDAQGRPVGDAWVALPGTGAWAATGPDGRFGLERVPAGSHGCLVRAPDGATAEARLTVPGPGIDLTLPDRGRAGSSA